MFLSHASEDKPVVLQVMRCLVAAHPDLEPWIDQFEIVSGSSLFEKIGAGMDAAEKFLVFLSPKSITKPWVLAELRDALTLDIQGVKPDFVIPVITEGLDRLPPFLRDKKHIDLTKLTQQQWLSEMKAAIDGGFADREVPEQPNLVASFQRHPSRPEIGTLLFSANFWAERLAFEILTSAKILAWEAGWRSGGFLGGYTELHAELEGDFRGRPLFGLRYARAGELLSPTEVFQVRYRVPKGFGAIDSLVSFSKWDGSGPANTNLVSDVANPRGNCPGVDDEETPNEGN